MSDSIHSWKVNHDAEDAEVYALLSRDPVWNCFALADLEPPLRHYAQFATAHHTQKDEHAICLFLRHPVIGQVLSPFGSVEGVQAILENCTLPEHPLIQSQEIHFPLLQRFYQPVTQWQTLFRMVMPLNTQPTQTQDRALARQLTSSDFADVQAFYSQQANSTVTSDLFTQNLYVGIRESTHLVAAGGTHASAPTHQIAVLGNIFTAPEARNKGYATAVTTALVTLLREQHFTTIVLNVFTDNGAAIHIYERIGFRTHLTLSTGKALLYTT